MAVLKNTYDVVVVKGAKTKIVDAVDCTGDTCLVDGIVATLTVKFPGISSVHTYVKVDDGTLNSATGGNVESRTYKTDETSMAVLKNTYDVVVVKGAKTKIVDAVDCTGDTCTVDNIVATLTVNFPGFSSVHVYVKTDDGIADSAKGGGVDNRTYQNNSTSLVVLKNTYDVVVVTNAMTKIIDAVNCYGDTCQKSVALVKLLNSTGNGLSGGTASYYDGSWHAAGTTNSSGMVMAGIDGAPGNFLFSMDYAFTHNEKWQNIATNSVVQFQTKNVVMQLKDSAGNLIPDSGGKGDIRYYTGAWHPFASGTTSGGQANMELLPANILFGITHQFVYNEKWQNTGTSSTVVFQTKNVVVQLKDSAGNLIPDTGGTGVVKYYTGAWHPFASSTTSGGQANMELLPANILFNITHQFVYNEKWQNTGSTPTVVFQTKNVVVQLQDHAGAVLDTGTVKYYTGAWHDFGATSGGQVSMELLPANILFRMDYAFTHNEKWQGVGTTPTVVFQAGQVHSNSGNCTQYYTGSWHAFTQDMELLPGSILFHFNDEFSETWYTITAAITNNIH